MIRTTLFFGLCSLCVALNANYANYANYAQPKFYDDILVNDAHKAQLIAEKLHTKLVNNADTPSIQNTFTQLVGAWKKTQATYILGYLDSDYESPSYIDTFHFINPNYHTQLADIINSTESLETLFYQHAHKSINALEYLLYRQNLNAPRVRQMAQIAAENMSHHLAEITRAYQAHRSDFEQDEWRKRLYAWSLNRLTHSIFELMDKRIGAPSGLAKKYNEPDITRAEYYLSGHSIYAIITILKTHYRLITGAGFEQMAAAGEVAQVITALKQAIALAETMQDGDLVTDKADKLYAQTKHILALYYDSLMATLGFVGEILDADGD